MADSPVGDDDGRRAGGKRELSQSKRAAQNRAAQVRCVVLRKVVSLSMSMMRKEIFEVGRLNRPSML